MEWGGGDLRASAIGASTNSGFSGYNTSSGFRDDAGQGLSFESINVNGTPYGSGLFILTSVGIAYSYIRRKRKDNDNR